MPAINFPMNIKTISAFGIAATALAAGCTMAPKYEQPELPVAAAYTGDTVAGGGSASMSVNADAKYASDIPWQDFFGDPRLRAIIALTLENNRDLRVAALRVEQARAQYQIERSALLPTVGVSGAMTRQRIPEDFSTTRAPVTGNQFTVGAGLSSYEIDFFGRVRSLKDAALQNYLSSEEAARSARLSLIATTASQYLAERALAEQLAIAKQTLKLVEDSRDLIQRRFDAGTASELDLATAKTQVYGTQASLADITRQLAQARNALELLVGAPLPANLPEAHPLREQGLITDLPAGLPSDLLTRRPDILQAEHTLRAANASIGAARAAFFPSITITGLDGFGSADLNDLFTANSYMWNFAPKINIPIFTGGRNKATLQSANANQKIMLAQYEKSIQVAFREVNDALIARTTYVDQIAAQDARVSSEQRRYDLSDLRYKQGVDNYLVVLTAQQSLFAAQQSLVQARFAQLSNLVSLYRALGGGWDKKG